MKKVFVKKGKERSERREGREEKKREENRREWGKSSFYYFSSR